MKKREGEGWKEGERDMNVHTLHVKLSEKSIMGNIFALPKHSLHILCQTSAHTLTHICLCVVVWVNLHIFPYSYTQK